MNKAKEIECIQAIFDRIEQQKNKVNPPNETRFVPSNRYTSHERFKKEQTELFQNLPMVVGVAGDLEKAGDYFLHDYSGLPIVVMKGKDEKIRAFLNICRHRGVRLLEEAQGHIKRNIVCPYHAWTYDTTGCLKNVFHPEAFQGVSAETHSLIELACEVHFGLVFVVPNPKLKGKFNLGEYVKEIYPILEGYGLENYVPYLRKNESNAFNWKINAEAGLETYHFKITHAKTIGPYFFDSIGLDIRENKFHCTTIYPKKSILKLKEQNPSEWNLRAHANILIQIFPNTTLLVMEDHAMVIPVFPKDEKNSIYKSFLLVPEQPKNEEEAKHFEFNHNLFWDAIEEDYEMVLLQQKSFNAYDEMPMTTGGYETLLTHYVDVVDQMLEGKLQPQGKA